jgi:class 3 adenylate cyclase
MSRWTVPSPCQTGDVDDQPIKIDSDWVRIDVESAEMGDPEPDGSLPVYLRFSNARYKRQDDGSVLDIQTNDVFPPKVWESVIEQILSAVANGQRVKSPERRGLLERLHERSEAIGYALEHPESIEQPQSPENPLADLVGSQVRLATLCIDLVGSTRLQASNPDAYGRIVPLLLRELAEIVGDFDGVIVNFTGDGLIAAFDGQGSSIAACDAAIHAATVMIAVVYTALNAQLADHGLPAVDIRIGADASEASVRVVGSASSRTQPDVYGMAVTMAAKIQAVGAPGEVWIGERLHGHLHVNNQVNCVPVESPASWRFVNGGNWAYKLYAIPVRSWVARAEAA